MAATAPRLIVRTFNKIHRAGLTRFDPEIFRVADDVSEGARGTRAVY